MIRFCVRTSAAALRFQYRRSCRWTMRIARRASSYSSRARAPRQHRCIISAAALRMAAASLRRPT